MQETQRYRMRLRPMPFGENNPIDLQDLACGGVGVWDEVEKRFVKKNERGEWVPESG